MQLRSARRAGLALVAGILAAVTTTLGPGSADLARAAIEVDSFETSAGLVRTSLEATAIDFDPVSGLLYAAVVEDGTTRLAAVDVGSVDVVADVIIGDGSIPADDLDVSRDGRTAFVVVDGDVLSYSLPDLSPLLTVVFPAPDVKGVLASPDVPDRFLALRPPSGIYLMDGEDLVDVTSAVDAGIDQQLDRPSIVWGPDSDSFFAYFDSELREVSATNPPVVERSKFGFSGVWSNAVSFQDGRLMIGTGVIDLETLDVVDQVPVDDLVEFAPVAFPFRDGTTTIAFRGVDGDWRQYATDDLSTPLAKWYYPLSGTVDVSVALSDGRLAILENATDFSGRSFLSIADPVRLGSAYGEFHPVVPSRVLDTRTGVGRDGVERKLGPGEQITVDIAGRGGLPETGVLAVVLNATVAGPTAQSFFSIWPSDAAQPNVSNLNFRAGQTIANFVTATVGEGGTVQLANEFGSAHAIFDVVGYYSTEEGPRGTRYNPIPSRRMLDTRASGTRLGPGETIEVNIINYPPEYDFAGRPIAAALNITAVNPSAQGYLTVWPSSVERPLASSLNFDAGDIRANLVVVGLASDGADAETVSIYNPFGSVDVLVDVFGVYEDQVDEPRLDQKGKFLPIVPFRSFDSRVDPVFDPPGYLPPNRSLISGNYWGWTDIWNVVAVNPSADGFLSVLGYDPNDPNTTFPDTSNVNFRAGQTVANAVYATGAPLNEIYNPFGNTHVVVDRFGYLTPETQRPVQEVWDPSTRGG